MSKTDDRTRHNPENMPCPFETACELQQLVKELIDLMPTEDIFFPHGVQYNKDRIEQVLSRLKELVMVNEK